VTNLDQLPPERDLPPDRHALLRTRVLTATVASSSRHGAPSRRPVRFAAASVAVAACAVIAWAGVGELSGSRYQKPEVYALGDGVLSPDVREAGRDCLALIRNDYGQPVTWTKDSPPTLLNHIEKDRRAVVIYHVQSKLIHCLMGPAVKDGPEPREFTDDGYRAIAYAIMDSSQWLPGPISKEAARSTDMDGGYVDAAGRVSARVARVVLDDGAGHQYTARLADGTFVVISDDRIPNNGGTLISYDASGKEIDRRPVLRQPTSRCYTDPAGNLVNPTSNYEFDLAYKSNKAQCAPAEPWSRRTPAQPTPQ